MDKSAKRWDLFALPHKGYRKMWADLLVSVGACDFSSETELNHIEKLVKEVCDCYKIHNYAENMIFQELQVKQPDVYHEWTKDHDEHVKELNGLVSLSEAIRKEPTEKRPEKGAELYDILSLFLSREEPIW